MTDHRTLRERIDDHFGQPCDGKSEGTPPATDCGVCDPSYPLPKGKWTCSGCGSDYPAQPAAEPPAPPAQVLTETELNDAATDVSFGKVKGNLNKITFSHEALRAEVARLQRHVAQLEGEIVTSNVACRTLVEGQRAAEAEAQALRERIAEVSAWAVTLRDAAERDLSPGGHRRFYDMRYVLALLSPAQEAP
jgi:hypothetical protein